MTYFLLCGSIFISIYFFLILETKFGKGFAISILILGCLNFIKREFIFHQYSAFDSLGFYMFSLFTIIMVFMYFNQVLKTVSDKSVFLNFDFWMSVAPLNLLFGIVCDFSFSLCFVGFS